MSSDIEVEIDPIEQRFLDLCYPNPVAELFEQGLSAILEAKLMTSERDEDRVALVGFFRPFFGDMVDIEDGPLPAIFVEMIKAVERGRSEMLIILNELDESPEWESLLAQALSEDSDESGQVEEVKVLLEIAGKLYPEEMTNPDTFIDALKNTSVNPRAWAILALDYSKVESCDGPSNDDVYGPAGDWEPDTLTG